MDGFVLAARERYGLEAPVALGFSNGANIAAALLLLHPGLLRGAALLRAMAPLRNPPPTRLDAMPVLLLSGTADPIVPTANGERHGVLLRDAGAAVTHRALPTGPGLSRSDIALTREWMVDL